MVTKRVSLKKQIKHRGTENVNAAVGPNSHMYGGLHMIPTSEFPETPRK